VTTDKTEPGTQVGNQTDTQSAAGGYPAGEWIDLKTAAELLGVSMNTVRRRRKAGELPGARLEPSEKGERWVVPLSVVQSLAGAQGAQVGTHEQGGAVVSLQAKVAELEQQLADLEREAERERARVAQMTSDLRHQVELQTLRADSHEQLALERLRVLTTQELALHLAQRKVLELETVTAKRKRWWHKKGTPTPSTQSVIQDTTGS
jgi:hypothetical protein